MFNKYYLQARLAPTVLTSIPLMVAYYTILSPLIEKHFNNVKLLPTISDITLPFAFIFLLVQINRLISKEIFQRMFFHDELKMPTTNYLLHSSNYFNVPTATKIREKILSDFNIELYETSIERQDEPGARKQITVAVSQVRNKLRNNQMLLRHNIEYGFFRNLIGGCVLAILISIFLIIYFNILSESTLKLVAIGLTIAYSIPVLLSKYLVNRYGKYYAKILYEQYLST
jgi:hypothetical protein